MAMLPSRFLADGIKPVVGRTNSQVDWLQEYKEDGRASLGEKDPKRDGDIWGRERLPHRQVCKEKSGSVKGWTGFGDS